MNWYQLTVALFVVAVIASILVVVVYIATKPLSASSRSIIGRTTPAAAFLVAGAIVGTCRVEIIDWMVDLRPETTSEAGAFSVSFPCRAEASERALEHLAGRKSVVGPVKDYELGCESKLTGGSYSVNFVPVPDDVRLNPENLQAIISSTASSLIKQENAKGLRVDVTPLYGHPAREIEYTENGYLVTARILVANRRVYRIGVIERPDADLPKKRRFFDSFRLTNGAL